MAFGNQQNYLMLIPVSSENEVHMHLVPAGQTVAFIDFSGGFFWLKSADANNISQYVRKFKFEEVIQRPAPEGDYVSKSEFEELKALILALGGKANGSNNTAISSVSEELPETPEESKGRSAGATKQRANVK